MKISVERQKLIDAITLPQSIADKKSGRISNILITAGNNNEILFTSTDLDIFITTKTQGKVDEEDKCSVNARKFYEAIRELPDEEIDIITTGNFLEIRSGTSRFRLLTSDPEDFPEKPTIEPTSEFEISSEILSDLINSTLFAAATDDIRPILGGILFEKNEKKLSAVATDSHRLSYAEAEIEELDKILFPEKGIIVPRRGASELNKLCNKSERIKIGVSENVIKASDDDTEIILRLIMGEYPNYRGVIPYDNPVIVEIKREDFISAVKRVSVISSEKFRGVKLVFTPDALILTSKDENTGDAEASIPISLEGNPTEIGFNARYLIECTIPFSEETIYFKLRDEMTATLIYEEEEMKKFVIIMPLNIQW